MTPKAFGARAVHAQHWVDLPERGTPAYHALFFNQRTRSPARIVHIPKARARPSAPFVACLPTFLLFRGYDFGSRVSVEG